MFFFFSRFSFFSSLLPPANPERNNTYTVHLMSRVRRRRLPAASSVSPLLFSSSSPALERPVGGVDAITKRESTKITAALPEIWTRLQEHKMKS